MHQGPPGDLGAGFPKGVMWGPGRAGLCRVVQGVLNMHMRGNGCPSCTRHVDQPTVPGQRKEKSTQKPKAPCMKERSLECKESSQLRI
eukprot:1137043-Pelagomonas_calceolata.AAC.5